MRDLVLRNLWVTRYYADLAVAFARRIEPAVPWCAFATWASRQAGRTIRGEDVRATLEHALRDAPGVAHAIENVADALSKLGARESGSALHAVVRDALDPARAMERASVAVSRGNIKVFQEIGRVFAEFIALRLDDAEFDETAIARFCLALPDGDPPEGKGWLRRAFRNYYEAMFEADPGRRAQLVLLANTQIGFHEQIRLQPEIRAALEAGVVDAEELSTRLLSALFPFGGWVLRARQSLRRLLGGRTPLDIAAETLVAAVRQELRRVITGELMVIEIPPDLRLRLSADHGQPYPSSVARLTLPDLVALQKRIDPTPDSPRDSGAVDWADFAERMHFIAELFRCYQESGNLLDPPFDAEQIVALEHGKVPGGRI
jgi:hypothetical protein